MNPRYLNSSVKTMGSKLYLCNHLKKSVIPMKITKEKVGHIHSNMCSQYTGAFLLHNSVRCLKVNKSVCKLFSTSVCCALKQTMTSSKMPHTPVLSHEVLNALALKDNGVYLDMTFGAGGHTKRILEENDTVIVYSLDRDPCTKKFASDLKAKYPNRFHPMIGKFSDLPKLLLERGISDNFFNGILMDLGVSSMHFDNPERGFMLSQDGPLDMRMDGKRDTETPTAAEILAHIDEVSLYRVLKYYGQEKKARSIARAIIECRLLFQKLNTTKELAELVVGVTGIEVMKDKLERFSHPATRTFQALRILVNDELNQLDCGVRLAHYYLQPEGILAAISFHSLEDTIIKRHLKGMQMDKTPNTIGKAAWKQRKSHLSSYTTEELVEQLILTWTPLTKHIVTPSDEEIRNNPRARSAKLRLAAKLTDSRY